MTDNTISVTQSIITAEAAAKATSAAIAKAHEIGVSINVGVVDRSGILVAFLRMPGAALHSSDIAIDKAYTAVSFGRPTDQWTEALKGVSEGARTGLPLRDRFVAFGGGMLIEHNGERIGAIGVSGASEAQDMVCAQAGIDAIISST